MTLREYARSLTDQNLSQTEMYDKIRAYSNSLESKRKEEEKAKKQDSQTADPSSESSDNTGSDLENGSSSQYEIPEQYTKVAQPGSTYKPGDGYEYKYEINKEGKGEYYTKKEGKDDWIKASGVSEIAVASEFGHANLYSTYKPGDGYEYKYEINKEGKGEYYTKKEGKDDWIRASGVSEIAVASEFGHANFNKEEYFAQRNANKKQIEEVKKLNEEIANQPKLTTVKETDIAYTNVADGWRTREGKKASKASDVVFDEEKGETVKVKKAKRVALTLEDFDGDKEQFEKYSKWKKLDDATKTNRDMKGGYYTPEREKITKDWSYGEEAYNDYLKLFRAKPPADFKGSFRDWRGQSSGVHTGKVKDSKGNWVLSPAEKLKQKFFKKYPNLQMAYTQRSGVTVVPKGTPSKEEWDKLEAQRKKYEASLDEGKFTIAEESDFSKFFTGEDRIQLVKATELVPTAEAVNDFNTKYILPDENGNSSDGINLPSSKETI